jgi:hypothetical protein
LFVFLCRRGKGHLGGLLSLSGNASLYSLTYLYHLSSVLCLR